MSGVSKNFGVLYTGYLDKRNPVTGSYKKRFVVLTHESLHWFRRNEGYDLFGEERGNVPLGNIRVIRMLETNSNVFEVQGTDSKNRLFRSNSLAICEEWVSAISSAIKVHNQATHKDAEDGTGAGITGNKKPLGRRATLTNIRSIFDSTDDDGLGAESDKNELSQPEVTVTLVALKSPSRGSEIVLTRCVLWDATPVDIPNIGEGDSVNISTSNGGSVVLSYQLIVEKSLDEIEFEVSIQNVPLASSLRLALWRIVPAATVTTTAPAIATPTPAAAAVEQASSKKPTNPNKFSTTEKSSIANIVLALAVLAIGSSRAVSQVVQSQQQGTSSILEALSVDSTLLIGVGLLLLFYNGFQWRSEISSKNVESSNSKQSTARPVAAVTTAEQSSVVAPLTIAVQMTILSHSLTSPDLPIVELDDEIPERFIVGCEGDKVEARRRWNITRHWRESEGVNSVLSRPQPHFPLIKNKYPHYHAGRGKEGHVVFYERPGEFPEKEMAAAGAKTEQLLQHWLFITEYQWEIMLNGDPLAKSITVIDLKGVNLTDLAGEKMNYTKATLGYANAHYPERSKVIFLVNAPWYCSTGWKIVKPLIHPNTQKKVKILSASETLQGLQEHIDISNIPEYYGGQLDFGGHDSCRFNSPETTALNQFVDEVNHQRPHLPPPSASTSASTTAEAATTVETSTPVAASAPVVVAEAKAPGVPPLYPHPTTLAVQKPTIEAVQKNNNRIQAEIFKPQFPTDNNRSSDEEWSIASNTTINSTRSGGLKGDSNSAAVRALTGRSNGYNSYNYSPNAYAQARPVQVLPASSPVSTISNSTLGRR